MSPITLTSLPAEIRQKILSDTIGIKLGTNGLAVSSPAASVCRQLHADVKEIIPSWLPTASTSTIIQTPTGMDKLHFLDHVLKQRAESSNRSWPGFQTIEVQLYTRDAERVKKAPKSEGHVRNPLRATGGLDGAFNVPSTWARTFRRMPASIKHIVVDLTMPETQLQDIEACGPDGALIPHGRSQRYTRWQREYWRLALSTIADLVDEVQYGQHWAMHGRGATLPAVGERSYEMIGKLPEGQVEVVAMDVTRNHASSRIRVLCWEQCLIDYLKDVRVVTTRVMREKREKKNQRAKELKKLWIEQDRAGTKRWGEETEDAPASKRAKM
ncbi:hypothetical protein BU16DRAFT_610398 [Lophium mytilinum]|uniref:Uncharacterized protein n=1 Tax=Lophium mytilinum TaxID=390894 RepID=A0A6A6QTL3_9PEZI|nr:hypothetical protein BU16DRAFT_610398 [Lophium mytilinum]